MDPVIAIVTRFKANQTVREFLAETMGTFILMVLMLLSYLLAIVVIPLLFASTKQSL